MIALWIAVVFMLTYAAQFNRFRPTIHVMPLELLDHVLMNVHIVSRAKSPRPTMSNSATVAFDLIDGRS